MRHLMLFPEQTSPRKPSTLPWRDTNENPSPLLRTTPGLRRSSSPPRPTEAMVPTNSPMDFAASIAAHFPLFPSRKSSVYPLLNVLDVSGTNPPETVPNDPLTNLPLATSSSSPME